MNAQRDDFNDNGGDSNPFSADLNSAFNSGASQGATQLFREGGFQGERRKKILLGVGLGIAIAAAAYTWWTENSSPSPDHSLVVSDHENKDEEDDFSDDKADKKDVKKGAVAGAAASLTDNKAGAKSQKSDALDKNHRAMGDEPIHEDHMKNDVKAAPAGKLTTGMSIEDYQNKAPTPHRVRASAPPTIKGPNELAKISYDETSGFADLNWEGAAQWLVLSRHASMQPVADKIRVHGHSHRLHNPYPGRWYWQVTNSAGASKTGSFDVAAPARRAIVLTNVKEGDSIQGNGGLIHWTGDTKVASYRVELSQNQWANPPHRFGTSGTQINIHSVPPGSYKLRVGGFSESSGRWEYTQPINVTVQ